MRSDDLKRYQGVLAEMRARLDSTIEQGLLELTAGPESGNPDESIARDTVDTGEAVEQTESGLLNDVQSALDRIEAGTFGQCVRCGDALPRERLKAVPYASFCVECERRYERDN